MIAPISNTVWFSVLIIGALIVVIAPFIIYASKKPSWVDPNSNFEPFHWEVQPQAATAGVTAGATANSSSTARPTSASTSSANPASPATANPASAGSATSCSAPTSNPASSGGNTTASNGSPNSGNKDEGIPKS